MIVCYCGNMLLSDGKVFSCPYRGSKQFLYGNDKKVHVGIEIIDKRLTVKK